MPTVEGVRGLANYGPTATLFTLGPNYTIQQYDLENPQMVANVQILPPMAPPTPPEDLRSIDPSSSGISASEESGDDAYRSPIRKTTFEMDAVRASAASPTSSRGRKNSSLLSSDYTKTGSPSRTVVSGTTFSVGTTPVIRDTPTMGNGGPTFPSYPQSAPSNASSSRSHRKQSRLRQEVMRSPEDKIVTDLFPFTRARLSDVPYRSVKTGDEKSLTPDALRRQMLSVVFGWDDDIETLLRDELNRHPSGSPTAVLLSKWLGNSDTDQILAMLGSGSVSQADWMWLALSQMGDAAQSKKVGQAFVQRLLEKGDIHASATILLGLGDKNDAVEVYVSRRYFMEAILLTCWLFPHDWQRQSFLVRKWGENVIENAQQHLAIRCFSCTGVEPSEPWTSPTAQQVTNFAEAQKAQQSGRENTPVNTKPPLRISSPPNTVPARPANAKAPALKLITSFGPQGASQFKFPGLLSDDRTPTNAPGVTPIAESAVGGSALSPGGLGSYRLNSIASMNAAMASSGARTATPGGYRRRLPSIGETPLDVTPPMSFHSGPKGLPTPSDSNPNSDKEKGVTLPKSQAKSDIPAASQSQEDVGPVLLSSARYDPGPVQPAGIGSKPPPEAPTPSTAIKTEPEGPPAPTLGIFETLKSESNSRNGSRDRKPEGLQIQWPPTSTDDSAQSGMSSAEIPGRLRHRRSNTFSSYQTTSDARSMTDGSYLSTDTRSDTRSPPNVGYYAKSPSVSGRSIDQYISSLEEAHYYSRHHRTHRHKSKDRSGTSGVKSSSKKSSSRLHTPSEDGRGRSGVRYIPPAKRSPSSPVPMSPDDLALYNPSTESFEEFYKLNGDANSVRSRGRSKPRTSSSKVRSATGGSRHRTVSPASTTRRSKTGKTSSRAHSRRRSPDDSRRARSKSNTVKSSLRSPVSPRALSPSGDMGATLAPGAESGLRFVNSDRQRLRSSHRSHSRRPERGTSAVRDQSPDRRRIRDRSGSRPARERELERERSAEPLLRIPQFEPAGVDAERTSNNLSRGGVEREMQRERTRKELAQAELEARRLSLARRPSAPTIPLPGSFHQRTLSAHGSLSAENSPNNLNGFPSRQQQSQTQPQPPRVSPAFSQQSQQSTESTSSVPIGLPATPRAMRHPFDGPGAEYAVVGADLNAPPVPEIPDTLVTLNDNVYKPDIIRRSMSAPIPNALLENANANPPLPMDLPMHPAYVRDIPPSSRSSSRTRTFSPNGRAQSRERRPSGLRSPPVMGDVTEDAPSLPAVSYSYDAPPKAALTIQTNIEAPPLLAELQHLSTPPPPPPPPAPMGFSHSRHQSAGGSIGVINVAMSPLYEGAVATQSHSRSGSTTGVNAAHISPPHSGSRTDFPPSNNANPPLPPTQTSHHRRGRSVNENFTNKIRNFADRMRSTSRGRKDVSVNTSVGGRSPGDEAETPSPYESLPAFAYAPGSGAGAAVGGMGQGGLV